MPNSSKKTLVCRACGAPLLDGDLAYDLRLPEPPDTVVCVCTQCRLTTYRHVEHATPVQVTHCLGSIALADVNPQGCSALGDRDTLVGAAPAAPSFFEGDSSHVSLP